jgi:AcrR family transcriptional regulator
MVQKANPPKRRGRPRGYDPQTALKRATEAFWKSGYSGTSLDELAAATGMNRPSLYAGFGDKRALYLKALDRYWRLGFEAMREAMSPDVALSQGLFRVFQRALAMYFSGNGRPRGCFAIGTATTEAVEDPTIRAALASGMRSIDAGFEARLRLAKGRGELPEDADVATLTGLASAVLSSLAIRSRAGTPRAELEAFARRAAERIASRD